MNLKDILSKIKTTEVDNVKLYFIIRTLKENVKKSSRMLEKYSFKVFQVQVDDGIRELLFGATLNQIEKELKGAGELSEYDVIADETAGVLKYSIKNKIHSFIDVVSNQLKVSPPIMLNMGSLQNEGELWAYCVGFEDLNEDDWVYTFRKLSRGKIVVDELIEKGFWGKFVAEFNTRNQKLVLMKGDAINLDRKIDCVYYEETFYAFQKTNFELLLGMNEEFKEEAKKMVSTLKGLNFITGLDLLDKRIEENPSIHKKLVRVSRLGNYRELKEESLVGMQEMCKQYGEVLNVKDGKICIEDEKDVEVLLKLLSDYYKKGELTGVTYGTYAGKKISIKR